MKKILLIAWLACLVSFGTSAWPAALATPVAEAETNGSAIAIKTDINLDSGPISGMAADGLRIYLSIPYVAPPVGGLRWRPPQPVAHWKTTKACTAFGPSCPQLPSSEDVGQTSEDCLYLNVWTPARTASDRLPVMVWIHGGAYNSGSGSLPRYNGQNLAKKGVVVVTINYRLGPFGFFVHPLLSKEIPQHVSGNYGLLDQIAALKWVQRNIALFGGDPNNVTIFGESAGAQSVSLLMISPLSTGLFKHAIAESGGPLIGSKFISSAITGDIGKVSQMGEQLTAKLGCDKAKDVLAALRSKSAQEILTANDFKVDIFNGGLVFAPVFDGWVLPKDPVAACLKGKQHDVPVIIGSNLDEGNLFFGGATNIPVEKYKSYVGSKFGNHSAQALVIFPAVTQKDVGPALDKIIAVGAFTQPARFVARAMEKKKSKAYLYQFTRRPDTQAAHKLGVYHSLDIGYVFGNLDKAEGYNNQDMGLSDKMMAYWVNFARTGDPNGPGLVAWPVYNNRSDQNLEFGDQIRVKTNLLKKECDFMRQVLGN